MQSEAGSDRAGGATFPGAAGLGRSPCARRRVGTHKQPQEVLMAASPSSPTSAVTRFQAVCVTCARGGSRFVRRYRDFLLDPGTLFTLASFVLLVAALIQSPSGLNEAAHAGTPLYLAAALAGSVYIWWSAIQGIRARDFTADIPVSVATAAAIAIGQ
jgi:hypothetical protein